MRISDWSSDVCSSDLQRGQRHAEEAAGHRQAIPASVGGPEADVGQAEAVRAQHHQPGESQQQQRLADEEAEQRDEDGGQAGRSVERRVGEEEVSKSRFRWAAYHYNKKTTSRNK